MRLISGCLQPTQLSWVLVLRSVAPPSLSRKAATDKLLQIIEADPNWPVYADVFPRLCPIWSDMTSVDTITQWREDWSSASVVNHTIVTDPTVRQSGFDLPCYNAYIAWIAVCVCLYVCWLRPWVLQYVGLQWRHFVPYPCQLVFAAILWVKFLDMIITVMPVKYALSVG